MPSTEPLSAAAAPDRPRRARAFPLESNPDVYSFDCEGCGRATLMSVRDMGAVMGHTRSALPAGCPECRRAKPYVSKHSDETLELAIQIISGGRL